MLHRPRGAAIGPGEQAEGAEANAKIHSGGVSTRDGGARERGVEDVADSAPPRHPAQPFTKWKDGRVMHVLAKNLPKKTLMAFLQRFPEHFRIVPGDGAGKSWEFVIISSTSAQGVGGAGSSTNPLPPPPPPPMPTAQPVAPPLLVLPPLPAPPMATAATTVAPPPPMVVPPLPDKMLGGTGAAAASSDTGGGAASSDTGGGAASWLSTHNWSGVKCTSHHNKIKKFQ